MLHWLWGGFGRTDLHSVTSVEDLEGGWAAVLIILLKLYQISEHLHLFALENKIRLNDFYSPLMQMMSVCSGCKLMMVC